MEKKTIIIILVVLIVSIIILILILGSIICPLKSRIKYMPSGAKPNTEAITPSDLGWVIPQTDPNNITTLSGGEEISSELISISVKDGVGRDEVEEIANGIGGVIAGELPPLNAYYIKFSPPKTGAEIEAIVKDLRTKPKIDTASPEFVYKPTGIIPSLTNIERIFCKVANFLYNIFKVPF